MKKATIGVAFLLLAGCASYRADPLTTLEKKSFWNPLKSQDIVIHAKAFDEADCERYLDRDVISKGYRPVQMTIENHTDHTYLFSLNRVSLPCARAEEVAEQVHTSTAGRAAGYGAAALFFWPFAIPAVVDGYRSIKANEALDVDFLTKAAKDQEIDSFAHVNMLMFVPEKDYRKVFHVTLIDAETREAKKFVVNSGATSTWW